MTRKETNKKVYNLLLKCVTWGDPEQAVEIMREQCCLCVTERTRVEGMQTANHELLTDEEMTLVLAYIKTKQLPDKAFPLKVPPASREQIKMVHRLGLLCSIHYCPLNIFPAVAADEQEFRQNLYNLFADRKLTGATLQTLYRDWLNKQTHRELKEGGLRYHKTEPEKPHIMMYDELNYDEAQHLIKVYKQMYDEIKKNYSAPAAVVTKTRGFYSK